MNQIICIVGPTGVGKTKLSIELAKKYNGEIINADSTQVYKEMDIATAKVTESEKKNIPHHLIDIKDWDELYTLYDYQKDCRTKIEEILSRNKTPILVGGTGLYIKAALYDYKLEEETNGVISYPEETSVLYKRLKQINPDTTVHPNNRKRIERALSYYEQTGKILEKKEKAEQLLYPTIVLGLTTERSVLYERIDQRVDIMMQNGLLEEARQIYEQPLRTKAIIAPIGYKELFDYFSGFRTLENCLDKIKQHSRNYAKRQYTWFRHQMNVEWIDVDFEYFENTVEMACSKIESNLP